MVETVDFISAPGTSDEGVYRPGGPYALVTNLAAFSFNRDKGNFKLESIHPGHTLEEILDNTGFAFDRADITPQTPAPEADHLQLLRGTLAIEIADPYPKFVAKVWGK